MQIRDVEETGSAVGVPFLCQNKKNPQRWTSGGVGIIPVVPILPGSRIPQQVGTSSTRLGRSQATLLLVSVLVEMTKSKSLQNPERQTQRRYAQGTVVFDSGEGIVKGMECRKFHCLYAVADS